jgi:hypothetical protein
MNYISILMVIFVLLTVDVTAQSTQSPKTHCPAVSVSCGGNNCYEPPFFFRADVSNADPTQKISFEWTVSDGQIVAGQGTSIIKVVGNHPYSDSFGRASPPALE